MSYTTIFLRQERLPYNEGWRPSTLETNWGTIGAMSARIQAASPPEENLLIGSQTMRKVLDGEEVGGDSPCQAGGTGCSGLSRRA